MCRVEHLRNDERTQSFPLWLHCRMGCLLKKSPWNLLEMVGMPRFPMTQAESMDWFIKGQWLGHFNPFYKKDPWISMKPWEKPWFPKSFSNQSIIHPLNSRKQKRSTQAHGGAGASWRIGFSNWSDFLGETEVKRRCITCVNPSRN